MLILTMHAGGVARTYGVVAPAQPAKRPALVIVLHGYGSTARQMQRYVGFEQATGKAAIVVYPQGVGRRWNDARGTDKSGPDDIAFLRQLIVTMERRYHTDSQRVFLAGMSNGGMMTLTAACKMPQITAVAAVVADLPASLQNSCRPAHPIPLLLIDGDADPIVPYNGGTVRALGDGGNVISAPQTVEMFRKIDGCSPFYSTAQTPLAADGTQTTFQKWNDCRQGSVVEFATVHGGGHAWPGRVQYFPKMFIGTASQSFDATRAIWAFFRDSKI